MVRSWGVVAASFLAAALPAVLVNGEVVVVTGEVRRCHKMPRGRSPHVTGVDTLDMWQSVISRSKKLHSR